MSMPDNNVTPIGAKPSATVIMVNRETAIRWLDNNGPNRNVRSERVAQYANDMAAGQWQLTGEAVKFAADGTLLDGQHRLQAVKRADVTVPMLVVRGLPPGAQSYMDTGKARAAGDALSIQGERNASVLAAAARIAIMVETDGRTGASRTANTYISHARIFKWIEVHPEIREAISAASRYGRSTGLSPAVLAYSYMRCAAVDDDAAHEFFAGLSTGANLPFGSPILALHARLQTLRINGIVRRTSGVDFVCMTLRAWNAWRTGRTLKQLKVPRVGEFVPAPV